MQAYDFDSLYRPLKEVFPNAKSALHHRNAFELLVATILSAQCTDKRVNLVTPALFARFADAEAMAAASCQQLEDLVRSTGFFRSKARNILATAQALVQLHGGAVPQDFAALLKLPGVARKTASVVLGVGFGRAEGVVVDTHVKRLAGRLALSVHSDPKRIELDLMAFAPHRHWIELSHLLIMHGRATCLARAPKCHACCLQHLCPSAPVNCPGRKSTAKKTCSLAGAKKKARRLP